jgi:SAM-dependent methyltransferase
MADVGAGKSLLLPTLLDAGYHNLTHVEWSQSASQALQRQLSDQASKITWFVGDLNQWQPPTFIDLWHDRAVFHFQMDRTSIQQYLHSLHRAVRPGGYALFATFHLDGPETCSGLPVQRYDASSLISTLNDSRDATWKEVKNQVWKHRTPSGFEQIFQYLLAQRT